MGTRLPEELCRPSIGFKPSGFNQVPLCKEPFDCRDFKDKALQYLCDHNPSEDDRLGGFDHAPQLSS
jgi:hypothetical protein